MEQFEVARKCICAIQQFNGNTLDLPNFIKRVESLSSIMEPLSVELKRILLGYIEDRLVDKARDSLARNGQVLTWLELRTVLIREHGDHTPKEKILDEINMCRCTHDIGHFYSKLNKLLVRLNNSYLLDDTLTALQATRNKNLFLEVFRLNLPEKVKGIIIGRNPSTMSDAYAIIEENGYLNFTGLSLNNTNRYNRRQSQNNNTSYKRNDSGMPNYRHPQQSGSFRQTNHFQPRNQGNFNRDTEWPTSSQSRQDRFTRQSRNFNASQRTRHEQNNQNQAIEPMDISSNFQNFQVSGLPDTCPI